MKAQFLTLPNALSGLRLLLVPYISWLLATSQHDAQSFILLAIAGSTDWLDGFLARRWNQVTRLGALLDPLADRLAIVGFLGALSARHVVPWAITAAVVARDLLLALLLPILRRHGQWALPVTKIGKLGTCALLVFIPLAFLAHAQEWTAWIPVMRFGLIGSSAIYWIAGLDYVRKLRLLVGNVKHSS
jgi:cardiolipin synthase (CMP-forming)